MRHLGLFEGIGGFSLAVRWMGWKTVAWCEINPFCQKVLRHHFPEAKEHYDITTTDFTIYRGKIDLITGGFPCQPYSVAGKRKGTEDDRHLWPQMLRAIREVRPRWVVGENVPGLVNWDGGVVFEQVQADLENEGYEVQPYILPACGVEAWHKRDRIWIIAYSDLCNDSRTARSNEAAPKKKGISKRNEIQQPSFADNFRTYTHNGSQRNKRSIKKAIQVLRGIQSGEDGRIYADIAGRPNLSTPILCRSYDGIPGGVDSVRAYGNAIVPQVAFQIFKAIEQFNKHNN